MQLPGDVGRCSARMDWLIEGNASRGKAVCRWGDADGRMAKSFIAAKRLEINGIGVEFLVE